MVRVYAHGDILGVLLQKEVIGLVFKWTTSINNIFCIHSRSMHLLGYHGSALIEHKIYIKPEDVLEFRRKLYCIHKHETYENLRFESQKFMDILLKGEPDVYL